jgi:hypothetical protein
MMHRPKAMANGKSTSLDGMEGVFEYHVGPLFPPLEAEAIRQAKGPDGRNESRASQEKRILRGSYSKGLLILKEDVLPTAKVEPEQSNGPELPSSNAPTLPKRNNYSNTLDHVALSDLSHIAAYSDSSNAVLLELIRTYVDQSRSANELIKHLTEQLQEKDEYIRLLLSGQQKLSLWSQLRSWMVGK